jgi:hypothetical protein
MIQIRKMAEGRLSFEQRKLTLKWYWKFENVLKVQRRWTRKFETTPPTRLTITTSRDKFETYGTVNDMCKQRSGRPRTSTSEDTSAMVLQQFTRSPKKSFRRCASEIWISETSVHRIIKTAKWKCYVPRSLHAMTEEDPDHRLEFCEWI